MGTVKIYNKLAKKHSLVFYPWKDEKQLLSGQYWSHNIKNHLPDTVLVPPTDGHGQGTTE